MHGGVTVSAADLSEEFSGCDFGDARLNRRACRIADALSQKPNVSIPSAFVSRPDIEACYRFFDNERVTPEKILRPHIEATHYRIAEFEFGLHDVVDAQGEVVFSSISCFPPRHAKEWHQTSGFREMALLLGVTQGSYRNCKHIANATLRGPIEKVLRDAGYEPPIICTPEELVEVDDDS